MYALTGWRCKMHIWNKYKENTALGIKEHASEATRSKQFCSLCCIEVGKVSGVVCVELCLTLIDSSLLSSALWDYSGATEMLVLSPGNVTIPFMCTIKFFLFSLCFHNTQEVAAFNSIIREVNTCATSQTAYYRTR